MVASTITSKGQVTIPKEIRDRFHLKAHDRLFFKPQGSKIFIKPVSGTILDIKGAFPVKTKISFERLREKMKKEISRKTIKEMTQ